MKEFKITLKIVGQEVTITKTGPLYDIIFYLAKDLNQEVDEIINRITKIDSTEIQ